MSELSLEEEERLPGDSRHTGSGKSPGPSKRLGPRPAQHRTGRSARLSQTPEAGTGRQVVLPFEDKNLPGGGCSPLGTGQLALLPGAPALAAARATFQVSAVV